MYDIYVQEGQDKAPTDETGISTQPKMEEEAGLFRALRETISDLEISLQNVLTFAGTFVIPLVALALGAPMAIAVAIALCLPIWFLVLKTINRVTSRGKLYAFGAFCSFVVLTFGWGVVQYVKPIPAQTDQAPNAVKQKPPSPELHPPAIQGPLYQSAGPCSVNVIGSGNTVANCYSDTKKDKKK